MKVSIERTSNGAVQFLYGVAEKPFGIIEPENVSIKEVVIPTGMPIVKVPAIQFSFPNGRGSQTVRFADLVNINGVVKPATIDAAIKKIINEVFYGPTV